ncbi:MAG: hypothetical protein WB586_06290 [Chthoniobacterales bacterium]
MMQLGYKLSQPSRDEPIRFATATIVDLRYRVALGDVILKAGDVDLSAPWGWIPLIDFVVGVRDLVRSLKTDGSEADFEFTESDALLRFRRKASKLVISSSYASGEAVVPISTVIEHLKKFEADLRAELLTRHPDLQRNAHFRRLMQVIE